MFYFIIPNVGLFYRLNVPNLPYVNHFDTFFGNSGSQLDNPVLWLSNLEPCAMAPCLSWVTDTLAPE